MLRFGRQVSSKHRTLRPTALRFQLTARGKTVRWLAEQTGIDATELSKIQNGKTATGRQHKLIAAALGFEDAKDLHL